MMDVIVEKGKLGISTYHIWDNDNREIACHKEDVVELIRKLQKALKENKRESVEMLDKDEPHRHDWDAEGNCNLCGENRENHYKSLG